MKNCRRCKKEKATTEFYASSNYADRLSRICKPCDAARRREQRARRRARTAQEREQAASTPAPTGARVILILSDVHVPEHDRPFWRAALAWAREHHPDEVILSGDFGEYASVSQHGGGSEAKLIDDLTSVKQALDELRAAVGESATITYLEGNHESRLPRAVVSWAPTFAGALGLAEMLELSRRNIAWVPEHQQPVHRGLLRVFHGHQVLGKYGPRHHAAKAADVYGSSPHTEIVYGHVHAAQTFTKPVAGGYVSATSIGCGRTIGPDKVRWLAGREAGWHHGLGVAYITDTIAQVYSVKVRDGRFIWNGKVYDGSEAAHVASTQR